MKAKSYTLSSDLIAKLVENEKKLTARQLDFD